MQGTVCRLRALYARDLDNLWLVGRDISVSHVALGATRLTGTIGALGHAVACAAAAVHPHDGHALICTHAQGVQTNRLTIQPLGWAQGQEPSAVLAADASMRGLQTS